MSAVINAIVLCRLLMAKSQTLFVCERHLFALTSIVPQNVVGLIDIGSICL